MECKDPDCPKPVAIVDGYRNCPVKLGNDNPDNLYESCSINSENVYILSVKRGSVHYLGFGTQAGVYGSPGGLSTVEKLYCNLYRYNRKENVCFQ